MEFVIILSLLYGVLAVPVDDGAFQEFVNGNHKFTAEVYKEILKNEQGNFLVSPLSAETVLALTNEGAKGETSAELVSGLHLPSTNEKTQKALKSFLPQLKKSDEELQLLSANRIYTGKNVKLEDDFRSVATTIYDSGIDNVDFEKNHEAAATINSWVENNTNHKIKNLVNPASLDGSTKVVLVNALYFSGKWQDKFKVFRTYKEKFFKTKDESVEVDTMHKTTNYNYYENPTLNAKFLELPYKGANVKLVIVLPNEKEGLASVEQNIEQVFAPQNFSSRLISLSLPKFTTESTIKFIPVLKNLGLQKIFSREADLSGVSSTDKSLYVSEVLQKAFINVTEKGTEAAAATEVAINFFSKIRYTSVPLVFKVDHSFLYFIKLDEVVLFTGRVTNL